MPEVKQYDTGLNLTALDTAPSSSAPGLYHVTSLCNIAAGDGQSERNGIKIQNRRLRLRIKCAVDPNSDASNANIVADAHTFRVVCYLDRSPNGHSCTWQQIFDYVPTDSGQLYDYQNKFQERRFQLLVDEVFTVPHSFVTYAGASFHSYGNNKYLEWEMPLNHATWYGDATSNLSAIQEGNVGLFICADCTEHTMPYMKFSYRSRIEFTDY